MSTRIEIHLDLNETPIGLRLSGHLKCDDEVLSVETHLEDDTIDLLVPQLGNLAASGARAHLKDGQLKFIKRVRDVLGEYVAKLKDSSHEKD